MIHRDSRFAISLAALCLTCATLLGSASHGRVERDRPPPAHTGGFGEPLCTACHIQADVNTGPGSIAVDGLPDSFVPGAKYTLTVTVSQEYLSAGGFQLSARHDDGRQAGTLTPAADDTARAAVTIHQDVQYIHHRYDGTAAVAPDTARWQIVWTAPAAGNVVFHVAANAADDDESPMGDLIYSSTLRTAAH